MSAPTYGSLFSGYGGLDLAIEELFGATCRWQSEVDPHASAILAHHWPDVPNLGDITKIDWSTVEPVDIICGGFPCFRTGTLVQVAKSPCGYDGKPTRIEDVRVGDYAWTHERRWRRVIQVMDREADHTVTVKAQGTPEIHTTSEHPFYARRRGEEPAWVYAWDLTREHFLAQQVDAPPPTYESLGCFKEVWYLIGRWLGDGWVVRHPRGGHGGTATRIHWCCSRGEADGLQERLRAAGLHPTRSDEATVTKFVMQSREWGDLLAPFGDGASGKLLPEFVHVAPLASQAALLQGWLDADGDVKKDGTVNATTTSRALALGMARVIRTVHSKAASIHPVTPAPRKVIEGREVNQRPYWNVRYSPGPNRQAFTADGFMWVPVRKVARSEEPQRVYNIGVEGDESYVAEGVVVHNCQDISSAGRGAGIEEGTRSGLWYRYADAVRVLRPRLVVVENVNALLWRDRGFDKVLGSLAEVGYDTRWTRLRASDVGACHRRERVFLVAWPADAARV